MQRMRAKHKKPDKGSYTLHVLFHVVEPAVMCCRWLVRIQRCLFNLQGDDHCKSGSSDTALSMSLQGFGLARPHTRVCNQ
jgi:hypothetical protein